MTASQTATTSVTAGTSCLDNALDTRFQRHLAHGAATACSRQSQPLRWILPRPPVQRYHHRARSIGLTLPRACSTFYALYCPPFKKFSPL